MHVNVQQTVFAEGQMLTANSSWGMLPMDTMSHWEEGVGVCLLAGMTLHVQLYFPLQKVHVVGFAPWAPSAAVGAAPWDAVAQYTRHLTWCLNSRDLPQATHTLPPSPWHCHGQRTTGPLWGQAGEKGRWLGQWQEKGGAWGLWQPCTPAPALVRESFP